jgi:peptidoglycan/LPS O-acetylase OafA/YrhL
VSPSIPSAPGRYRLTDLDALRGIAVAMVVFAHVPASLLWPPPNWMLPFVPMLAVGVEIFFAISGFVIGRSLLPEMRSAQTAALRWPTIRRFWIRRAWRLLPAAYLWLIIACGLSIAVGGWFDTPAATLRSAGASALYLANVLLSYRFQHGLYPGPLFHYWSLSLEEQFYFVVPFVILLPRRWLGWFLLIGTPVACGVGDHYLAGFRIEELIFGLLLALCEGHPYALRIVRRLRVVRPPWGPALSFAVLIAITQLARVGPSWGYAPFWLARLGVAVASTTLVLFAATDQGLLVGRGRIYRSLLWLGRRSYSIYLVHICAFFCTKELTIRLGLSDDMRGAEGPIAFLIGFIILAVFAEPTYRFVEIGVRQRFSKPHARQPSVPADFGRQPQMPPAKEPSW